MHIADECRGSPRTFSRRADEAKSWVSNKPPPTQPPQDSPAGSRQKAASSEGRWGKQEAPAQPANSEDTTKPASRMTEKTNNMCEPAAALAPMLTACTLLSNFQCGAGW